MPDSSNKALVVAQPIEPTKNGKRDAKEIIEKKVASGKKQKIANGGAAHVAAKKKDDLEDESESDDGDSVGEEDVKDASEVKDPVKPATKIEEESNDDRGSSDQEPAEPQAVKQKANGSEEKDDTSKVEEPKTAKKDAADVEMVDAPSAKKAEDAKDASEVKDPVKPAAKIEEESNDDKESSDQEPVELQAIKEANGSEEEDDCSKEEEEPKTAKKDGVDVEMVDAPSAEKAPQTPATPQATGSKILFMGNLNFSIEENDVLDFFKDVGGVVKVQFAMRDDRFAGFAHVEFATPDAALKALKLDKELLLDRAVRLELAKERGTYTPSNNSNDRSSQKSGQSQGLTVFVRGFGTNDGFESVRSALEEHFGQCGEIKRLTVLKDYESQGPKGVAFIDFTDGNTFNKALELSGTKVRGGTITVEEAKQSGGGGGGYGRGRGGMSGGRGWFGGREGGRGRGRGRGR